MPSGTSTGRRALSRGPLEASSIASYSTALRYLYAHIDVERMRMVRSGMEASFKLDRVRALLAVVGNPQESLRTIHIAGTKGKGSTTAMTAAALQGCGYTVGTFTSPHLVDIRERLAINNRPITQKDFTRLLKQVGLAAESVDSDQPFHFFELLTAMGFLYFAEKAVDAAVIEVGLGGRLDSTNIMTPAVCAITHISLDHTHILGETLEAIAREKAGILKKGVPAVSVPQEPEVEKVLRETAAKVGCEIRFLGNEIRFTNRFVSTPELGPHACVSITTDDTDFEHVPIPLKGEHQAVNGGLTLAIIDCFRHLGCTLPEDKVVDGLAQTKLAGRMEIIRDHPRTLIDGAHNPESLKALIRALGVCIPYDSLVVIFGCSADKNIDDMLRAMATGADKVIFTRTRTNPRAADPEDLQARFNEVSGKMSQVAPTLEEAIALAERAVNRGDLIAITGSFYLVGEAKKMARQLWKNEKDPPIPQVARRNQADTLPRK